MKPLICVAVLVITTICFSMPLFAWTESLASIRNTADTVQSISASFVQEKHLAILKKPLISKGLLLFQKPNALRWEYLSPVASIMLSYQGKTARYLKQDDAFIKDVGSQLQVMQVILGEISNWLTGRFSKGGNFTATVNKNRMVTLKPSNREMTKMISHIDIHLSLKPGLIESVTIYENKNSFTKLIFQNTTLNDPIKPTHFQNP